MAIVKKATDNENWISHRSFAVDDGTGKCVKACVWDQPGDDVLGMIARSRKVVQTMTEVSTLKGTDVGMGMSRG